MGCPGVPGTPLLKKSEKNRGTETWGGEDEGGSTRRCGKGHPRPGEETAARRLQERVLGRRRVSAFTGEHETRTWRSRENRGRTNVAKRFGKARQDRSGLLRAHRMAWSLLGGGRN